MPMKKPMMSITAVLLLAASSLPLATLARADSCEVSLNYDVRVAPQEVVFSDKGQEQYRIENDQLYIEGQPVNLSSQQQDLVRQYANEITTQVPQAIELVDDAVSLAFQTLSHVVTPLLDDKASKQFDEQMAGLKNHMGNLAYQQGDQFYLGATAASIQNTFNQEFEQQVEELMQQAIGTIIMNIGEQMVLEDSENVDTKMQGFSEKMATVSQVIEQDLEAQSKTLEVKAQELCGRFNTLRALEQRLRQQVPALAPYTLTSHTLNAARE